MRQAQHSTLFTMLCLAPKETHPAETRVALTPESVARLKKLGVDVVAESGLGARAYLPDERYTAAGARVLPSDQLPWKEADVVLRVRKPDAAAIPLMRQGCLHLSFMDPFRDRETVEHFASAGISAVSMEMIPRTTWRRRWTPSARRPTSAAMSR
jgi:H+-translocating NAD(P) transhydrogenase subunit alpha